MILQVSDDAGRELLAAARRYNAERPGSGIALVNEFHRAVSLLLRQPRLGREIHPKTRRFRLRGFPYSLVYRLKPDAILCVAMVHDRRRPGYWLRRLDPGG